MPVDRGFRRPQRQRARSVSPRRASPVPRRPLSPLQLPRAASRSRSRSRSPSSERLLVSARQRDQDVQAQQIDLWRTIERNRLRGYRFNRSIRFDFTIDQTALRNRFQVYDLHYENYDVEEAWNDLTIFLAYLKRSLRSQLTDLWQLHGGISWSIRINVQYQSGIYSDAIRDTHLSSSHQNIYIQTDIMKTIEAALGQIEEIHNNYQEGRSDWILVDILPSKLYIRIAQLAAGVMGGGRRHYLLQHPAAAYLPAPQWINNRKCLINVKNQDKKCFRYAMEVAWYHKHNANGDLGQNPERITDGKYLVDHFDYSDLFYPVHPLDLDAFERKNSQHQIQINVIHANNTEGEVSMLRHPSRETRPEEINEKWVINLLILDNSIEGELMTDSHWCYITKLPALLRAGQAKTKCKRYLCTRCLRDFRTHKSLCNHQVLCGSKKAQVEVLPSKEDAYRYFKDMHKLVNCPFVIYADFESFNKILVNPVVSAQGSKKISQHVAASYCFQVVCQKQPQLNWYETYSSPSLDWHDQSGQEVGKHFIQQLLAAKKTIDKHLTTYFAYPPHQNHQLRRQGKCCYCQLDLEHGYMRHWYFTLYDDASTWIEEYNDSDDNDEEAKELKKKALAEYWTIYKKLSYHRKKSCLHKKSRICQLLFKRNSRTVGSYTPYQQYNNYIGSSHYACHRSAYKSCKIPVVFHNLSGYDGHLIMQSLDSRIFFDLNRKDHFTGIPQAGDKFMAFSFCGLEFIDSYRFMLASLDDLTDNLRKEGEAPFKITQHVMKEYLTKRNINYDAQIRTLLMKKGQFPYEYFDHPRRFLETSLPTIESFHNTLRNEQCSPSKYCHAQEVWTQLKCETFRDYHDIYLLLDVILLADIFENFRLICMQENGLEPLKYISLPGYTFDASLRYVKVVNTLDTQYVSDVHLPFEHQLFSAGEEDKYEFVEASIRGGISMTPGRLATANHRFMHRSYDPGQLSSFIALLDANNLYGYAMSQSLPLNNYHWIDPKSMSVRHHVLKILAMTEDQPMGMIYEVDGYFPDECHDNLSDFPPVPVNETIPLNITSPYYNELCQKYDTKHDHKTPKLLCNLLPKTRYKVYYRSLQQYIQLGFEVTKIHRILGFTQCKYLAGYIDFNTKKRALAKTEFEKEFFKLLLNSLYGKFIQDNRKFQTVRAIGNNNYANKSTWDPFITHFRLINENLVLAYMKRGRILLNSPITIGSVILDQSKWLMYDFWYRKLKPVFGTRLRLLFTDTDSLCMHVETNDLMVEMKQNGLLNYMDLSNWPKDTSYFNENYYDPQYQKVIGKFKWECVGQYIREVIALRSKMYSIDFYERPCRGCQQTNILACRCNANKATAKGVSKPVKQQLTHMKYMECLLSEENYELQREFMHRIGSINNQLYLSKMNKITLSPNDSKLWLKNSIETLPYGHYRIPVPETPISVETLSLSATS